MKIQLLTLICAAFGLSLPEIPNLPDLVGIVDNAVHGNFTAQTVEEPQEFLPTIVEIRAMTDQEKTDRFHWFLCVFLLVFVCVVISGTVIMMVGAELKALGSYQALGETTPLSQGAQLRLVMLSFGSTVLLSFAATLWSLENGRLSKSLGLDWEVYLFLFCCAGAFLLVQALLAVAWLNRGDRFDATAFTVASFSSMAPLLSDQWDTLKDIIFGGLCLQSRQVTRSKRHHLLIESVPQGVMSVLFLTIEGGSFFIAALNLVVPSVQIALTCFLFKPMRAAAIPALGKRLSRAMKSGNIVAAKALWEEAEITGDRQLFQLILPHLTFFLATVQSCGFMSEEMKDLEKLSDEELDTLQCIASVFAGEALCDLSDLKIGDSGAKVVAEALKSSTTRWLYLGNNDIGDEGAEALADSLKSNSSLVELYLPSNNIGDRGAEALADSLKSNSSLVELYLPSNNIGDRGAEALAESLQINGSLGQLDLQNNNIGDPGTEVLAAGLMQNRSLRRLSLSKFGSSRELWRAPGLQALEEAEKIKREWGDDCEICWY